MAITLAVLGLADGAQAAPVETVLYRFTKGEDGTDPFAGLIIDKQGAFYGTTLGGGLAGHGTVFKLTPSAAGHTNWIHSTLHSFSIHSRDGAYPGYGSLIFDTQGALYGTTQFGGPAMQMAMARFSS